MKKVNCEPNGTRGMVLLVLVALMLSLAVGAALQQSRTDELVFLEGCVDLCNGRYTPSESYCDCVTWCCEAYDELSQ